MQIAIEKSSLGNVLVALGDKGIKAILIGDDIKALKSDLKKRFPGVKHIAADDAFQKRVAAILRAIEHPGRTRAMKLDAQGTPFQQKVWDALRQIPLGQTASYKDIANKIGNPAAVRAVARACAANPIAILIPCHRVLRSDGGISGYRWGVERKRELIAREHAATTTSAAA